MSEPIKVRHPNGSQDWAAPEELRVWLQGGWTVVDDESDTAESEQPAEEAEMSDPVDPDYYEE